MPRWLRRILSCGPLWVVVEKPCLTAKCQAPADYPRVYCWLCCVEIKMKGMEEVDEQIRKWRE